MLHGSQKNDIVWDLYYTEGSNKHWSIRCGGWKMGGESFYLDLQSLIRKTMWIWVHMVQKYFLWHDMKSFSYLQVSYCPFHLSKYDTFLKNKTI